MDNSAKHDFFLSYYSSYRIIRGEYKSKSVSVGFEAVNVALLLYIEFGSTPFRNSIVRANLGFKDYSFRYYALQLSKNGLIERIPHSWTYQFTQKGVEYCERILSNIRRRQSEPFNFSKR